MAEMLVGVLITIPPHMIKIYKEKAYREDRTFTDVVADECNNICAECFKKIKEVNDDRLS